MTEKNVTVRLISPLGGQPQIVTFTVDLLLARGEPLTEVWTVFPAGNVRYQKAHHRLTEEFAHYPAYRRQGVQYRAWPIDDSRGRPLQDITNVMETDRVWQVIGTLMSEAKTRDARLHISLSGGRRALALMLFSAAMLYCTPGDRAWHIYTPPQVLTTVKDGARLHVGPEEGVRLLEIPFVPWGAFFPGVKAMLGLSPRQLAALQAQWPDESTAQRCASVWRQLTPRQREVLQALVEQPTRQAAADTLGLSLSTLDTHRAAILDICRLAWPDAHVDLHFLRRVFRGWLLLNGSSPPQAGDLLGRR